MRFISVVAISCAVWLIAPEASAVTLTGDSPDPEAVFGTSSQDVLSGGSDGINLIYGKHNPNTRRKRRRNGRVKRVPSPDLLTGGAGLDYIFGGTGRDVMTAGDSFDGLRDDDGTPGDVLRGQGDDDLLISADGAADTLDCGGQAADIAIADAIDSVTGCGTVVTGNGTANFYNVIFGTALDDSSLNGTSGIDLIVGQAGADTIAGGDNDDLILGGPGADTIDGGVGTNDVIVDDDGTPGDVMTGSHANDVIHSADGAVDTIHCTGPDAALVLVIADPDDILDTACIGEVRGHGEIKDFTA